MNYFLTILLFIVLPFSISAQNANKFTCDISIKEKMAANQFSLLKGSAIYSKLDQKTTFNFVFPNKETWEISKDKLSKTVNGKLVFSQETSVMGSFSIFRIFCEGNLKNYGLKNSTYQAVKVSEENGQIITTWELPKVSESEVPRIITSVKDSKLAGVAFFNRKGKLLSKQIFSDYTLIQSIAFPGKITEVLYIDGKEQYKITSFSNLKLE